MNIDFAIGLGLAHTAILLAYLLIFQRWWLCRVALRFTGLLLATLRFGTASNLVWHIHFRWMVAEKILYVQQVAPINPEEALKGLLFLSQQAPDSVPPIARKLIKKGLSEGRWNKLNALIEEAHQVQVQGVAA